MTQPLEPAQIKHARLHLALIPVYLWLIFTWVGYARSISTPGRLDKEGFIKGHDFVHFYALGQIALERRPSELYSAADQAVRTDRVAGYEDRYVPVYGPQVSLFFAPFALLPYQMAWVAWTVVSALLYGLSCFALWRSEPVLRLYKWPTLIAALGYPPFAMLIAFGHISAAALAAFTLGYLALRHQRRWLAGFALGCVFFKPPLGLVLPLVFLYGREWRIIFGAVAAVALQLAVAWAYYGHGVLDAYWHAASHLGQVAANLEPQPHQMQSLRSLFAILLPWPALALACYVTTAMLVVMVAARCWRTAAPIQLRYAVLLLAAILVDPHVNVYDLVVLAPIFIIVPAWGLTRHVTGWVLWSLLYFCYYSPIYAHLVSTRTAVQVSVIGLVALMWGLIRAARLGL